MFSFTEYDLKNLNNPTEAEANAVLAKMERLRRERPPKRKPRKASATMTATHEDRYRQEYAEQQHIHQQLGVSIEDYIDARMIEDGHKNEPNVWPENTEADKPKDKAFAGVPGLVDVTDPAWN